MNLTWPLVGRDRELGTLEQGLARPGWAGAVLAGPPGVGKTRLAGACVALAERHGLATAQAHATRSAISTPLGALAPLLPELGAATGAELDLLQQARRALADRAAGRPLLLVVDDGHTLDDASATLIHQLVAAGDVAVLMTIRTGEAAPDPVVALWKDALVERLDISVLNREQVDRIVVAVLDGPVDGATRQQLWTASQGNALFLREMITAALDRGDLVQEGGVWRLTGSPGASPRLVELVGRRLGQLNRPEQAALRLIAFGEPIGRSMLEGLAGAEVLAGLDRRGLLAVVRNERRDEVWLTHPLYGEVLRADLDSADAAVVNATLAEGLERTGVRRRGDLLRLGNLTVESAGAARAEVLVAAARQARYAESYQTALKLARAAWAAGGGFEAGHLLGDMLGAVGEAVEADLVLAKAQQDATTDEQRAMATMTRAGHLFWSMGRGDLAKAVYAEGLPKVSDAEWRDQMVAHSANFSMLEGRPLEALAALEPILAQGSGRPFLQATFPAAPALAVVGRTTEAAAIAEAGYAEHMRMGDVVAASPPGIHLVGLCMADFQAGRLDRAGQIAAAGYEASTEIGNPSGMAWFGMVCGLVATLRGEPVTATRWFRESVVHFTRITHPGGRRWCLGGMALGLVTTGDLDGAAEAIDQLDHSAPSPILLHIGHLDRARGWLQVASGDRSGGQAFLLGAARRCADGGQYADEATLLHDVARVGAPERVLARMTELSAIIDGDLMPIRLAHVSALVDDDGDGLDGASDQFEAIGCILLAAEAAAEEARAHQRHGEVRPASASELRSRSLAARCEGARTPALDLRTERIVLSDREREIAALAASGLASKAIAEHTYLSVRTVTNHLQRVYAKLGVSGRSELAAALSLVGDRD
ncbi:MAG: hypothetical protein QOG64_3312 [Acidimicrobiaceae bacterium]|nr:hypothetical protein [Acidimicrobiaceae bacterium]